MSLGAQLRFVERTKVLFEGRAYVFFGGTDYHRLASHPEVVRAFQEAARSEGLSCAGSRVTTGNHPLLMALERQTGAFLGAGDAALCAAGYLANTVALEAVACGYQRFFAASGIHASLATPADTLPRDRVHAFRDADPEDLARELRTSLRSGEKPLVLTDGVVSGDGAMPPLADYWELVRHLGGALLVDDSHGVGVVGPGGQGSPAAAGLPPEAYVQTGTFAKAFGVFGGLVAGRAGLRDQVAARSRAFVGATPIPPPAAAAALKSLAILEHHPTLISGLQARMRRIRERMAALGLPAGTSPAPILSVTHGDEARNARLASILLQAEIYPTFINYPGCPPGGHFRFTFSSAHTDEEVERLVHCIASSC
jgi:8-amino-7-oxononanoate synthase